MVALGTDYFDFTTAAAADDFCLHMLNSPLNIPDFTPKAPPKTDSSDAPKGKCGSKQRQKKPRNDLLVTLIRSNSRRKNETYVGASSTAKDSSY
jgi:hypothetical protein